MILRLRASPEREKDAIQITDLKECRTLFVRHQVDLEHWRSVRYSPETQRLVAESACLGVGLSPKAAAAGFLDLHGRITAKVKD